MKHMANEVIKEAIRSYKKDNGTELPLTRIAENIGVSQSTLYHNLNSRRAWPVERWLDTLFELGALECDGESIVIHSKKLAKMFK